MMIPNHPEDNVNVPLPSIEEAFLVPRQPVCEEEGEEADSEEIEEEDGNTIDHGNEQDDDEEDDDDNNSDNDDDDNNNNNDDDDDDEQPHSAKMNKQTALMASRIILSTRSPSPVATPRSYRPSGQRRIREPNPSPENGQELAGGKEGVKKHSRDPDSRFLIVLDAENIAMHCGKSRYFRVAGIQAAAKYYMDRGHKVTAFVPDRLVDEREWKERWETEKKKLERGEKASPRIPDDLRLMKKLHEQEIISVCPGDRYSDSFTVMYAYENNGIVVSNDRFRDKDLYSSNVMVLQEWMKTHRIGFSFVGDDFFPDPSYRPPMYKS